MQVDHDPVSILQWCADNNLNFGISRDGDTLAIKAKVDNIQAEYQIDSTYTPDAMGKALYMALLATKHGAEFHRNFGYFPPISKKAEKPLPEMNV